MNRAGLKVEGKLIRINSPFRSELAIYQQSIHVLVDTLFIFHMQTIQIYQTHYSTFSTNNRVAHLLIAEERVDLTAVSYK